MNYRHAFHAGSFADCMKHALLVWLIDALQRKPAPIFVLDTHAGAGRYDLTAGPAQRTGEWRQGIGRLIEMPQAALGRYLGLIRTLGLYPGSPALIRAMLRPEDRLACCELQPDDLFELRRRFARDSQVAVHQRDAREALAGLLPPKERRGLVLIDPPFENAGEFSDVAAGLATAQARFRAGVLAAWYPIKHRAPVRGFHTAMQQTGIRDIVAAELCLREPLLPDRLNGCGLLVVNPPYRFEQEAQPILQALLERLGRNERGAYLAVTRIAAE
ncbi:MAG TPA: 23S rRNA (adenine(2030)-N(6))-methyltransferase RlmJ [Acetobacteraceae bacterium]|nr:23S rRNA (adenine(2030)-N(6))-methyltransferase RlmJ [Acetobacteraceae bacterium]